MKFEEMVDQVGRFAIGAAFYQHAQPISKHTLKAISAAISTETMFNWLKKIAGSDAPASRDEIKNLLDCYNIAFEMFDLKDAVRIIGNSIRPQLVQASLDNPELLYAKVKLLKPVGFDVLEREKFDAAFANCKQVKPRFRSGYFLRSVWYRQISEQHLANVEEINDGIDEWNITSLKELQQKYTLDNRVLDIHIRNLGGYR